MSEKPAHEPRPAASKGRLDGLTGIRAVAALWVVAFHYRGVLLKPLGIAGLFPLLAYGYLGVDLFFMLSGFVIAHVHGRDFLERSGRTTFLRFLALRFARLYPVYVATLGLLAALLWLSQRVDFVSLDPADYRWGALALQLAMIQSWGFVRHLAWNYPNWSVSAEWFAYLLFPFVAVPLFRLGRVGIMVALFVCAAVLVAVYAGPFDGSMNHVVGLRALLRAADEFAIGCALRRLLEILPPTKATWSTLVAVPAAAAAVAGLALSWLWGLVPVLAFPLIILASSIPGNPLSTAFTWRPFVIVGEASYALYLMQAPVQRAAHVLKQQYLTAGPLDAVGVILAYVLLLTIGTAIMHRWVERPARRCLRSWIDRVLHRVPAVDRARASE